MINAYKYFVLNQLKTPDLYPWGQLEGSLWLFKWTNQSVAFVRMFLEKSLYLEVQVFACAYFTHLTLEQCQIRYAKTQITRQ